MLESLGELLCLVVGAFGEVSEDLERTIKPLPSPGLSSSPGRLDSLCLRLRKDGCGPVHEAPEERMREGEMAWQLVTHGS